jgi:glycosidase
MLDDSGEIRDPVDARTGKSHGWTDVAELDYSQPELRRAMIEAMKFWLTETGIDGFRVDVASEVPIEFWREAVPELKAVNPDIFLLAEAENPEQRNEELFHMSYAWSFHHLMNRLAQGKAPLKAIDEWLAADRKAFKRGYHMHFIDNHDENSWNGTVAERLGPAADALAVLAFTFDGMPLLYSGQEARLDKRLAFFEKDQIDWRDFPLEDFYRALLELKRRNRALWNGSHGGHPRRINTGKDRWVYAFYREKDEDRVIVLLNLSSEPQEITLHNPELQGDYVNIFGNSTVAVTKNMMLKLNPWDYVVWSNR